MFNSIKNILTIVGFTSMKRWSAVSKKRLAASAIVGVYIFLPCFGERAFSFSFQKVDESLVGVQLIGIGALKNVVDNLIAGETVILIDNSGYAGEDISEFVGGFADTLGFPVLCKPASIEKVSEINNGNSTQHRGQFVIENRAKDIAQKFYHWLPLWVAFAFTFWKWFSHNEWP